MRRTLGPLLCELHAHTCWSDGSLSVPELVDLHGRNGFDVLCVTDHVIRTNDPWREREGLLFSSVDEESWPRYLAEVEREAARAWRTYGMRGLAHRFELFNRTQLFGWVADAGLPAVACGDFHDLEHLAGWKTLLPSMHDEAAVVDYLRSRRPVYLIRLEADTDQLAA